MPHEHEKPFRESHLESVEYRARLMRKLNCLIAVLEVANAKVKKSLAGPEPDEARLKKIQTNLTSTLEVCHRARRALERREALPKDLPENLADVVRQTGGPPSVQKRPSRMPLGARHEMGSTEEFERFQSMGRIRPQEVLGCDMDLLSRLLQED